MEEGSQLGLKEQGNELFRAGKWEKARDLYTKALESQPEDVTLFSNRAAAHLKLGAAAEALADAERAVQLRGGWDKAHFRRGCALEMLGKLEPALQAFQEGLQLNPDSKELNDKVRALDKRLRKARRQAEAQAEAQARAERTRAGASRPFGAQAAGLRMPGPDSWAQGLGEAQQYEWLVDCYRMRVDDDYAWGGGYLHGLYAPDATKEEVLEDFLVFCKLAVRNRVVPAGGRWSWPAFLRTAARLLPYAFEKADAKEKWGGENVFAAMMGGRSLRATGEVVLGSSCMGGGDTRPAQQLHAQVHGRAAAALRRGGEEAEALVGDMGGAAAWRELLGALRLPGGNWG